MSSIGGVRGIGFGYTDKVAPVQPVRKILPVGSATEKPYEQPRDVVEISEEARRAQAELDSLQISPLEGLAGSGTRQEVDRLLESDGSYSLRRIRGYIRLLEQNAEGEGE